MKKYILIYLLVFCNFLLNAQFYIKGEIENYNNKRVSIKFSNSFSDYLQEIVTTDNNGKFASKINKKYIGNINIILLDSDSKSISVISNNSQINLKAKLDSEGVNVIDYGNYLNANYYSFIEKYKNLPDKLNMIESYDMFYKNLYSYVDSYIIDNHIKFNNLDKDLFLYFINKNFLTKKITSLNSYGSLKKSNEEIINLICNEGEFFDNSGYGAYLLVSLIKINNTLIKNDNSVNANTQLYNVMNNILNSIGEDTDRGQDFLYALIGYLRAFNFNVVADKFIKKAQDLTCSIDPKLKSILDRNNKVSIGNKIKNIRFTNNATTKKYKSLYDIKSKYKLVVVWATWCPHCMKELPKLKELYYKFNDRLNIIGLSIDSDKNKWKSIVSDLPWINDSEFMYWDSTYISDFNVFGTPTLILVDSKNNIIAIDFKVENLYQKLK